MKTEQRYCDNCQEKIEERGNETPCGREGFSILKSEPMMIVRNLDFDSVEMLGQICYQCLRTLLAYRLPRRVVAHTQWSSAGGEKTLKPWTDDPITPIDL